MDFLIVTNYLFREDTIHLSSPLLYMLFVYMIQFINPIPTNKTMIFFRKWHNISLSVLSLFMFTISQVGQYQTGKFESVDAFLCKPYGDNLFAYYSTMAFLYSKYLEWGDTLFLQLSGKPITMLQYTHHMSTAFITYVGLRNNFVSPFGYVPGALNCFVHVPMYWYFAFPRGSLHPYRRLITISQIVQHIICILTMIYIKLLDNCEQNGWTVELGLALYFMYLFYFVSFYVQSYKNKSE
jgi:hypothetical protein